MPIADPLIVPPLYLPKWEMSLIYGISGEKARFALWSLYNWCLAYSSTSIVDTKAGSSWTSPSTLANNDWFVARWINPLTPSVKFDAWFQATDAANLNVPPLGSRGLFVRIAYHSSLAAWNGVGGAYGTPFFKTGSSVLPVSDQMSSVATLMSSGVTRIHIVGDRNCLMLAVDEDDSRISYDGFYLGNYAPYQNTVVPLILTAGNLFRLGTSGLSADQVLSSDQSGIIWTDNTAKPLILPYLLGNLYSSYCQPFSLDGRSDVRLEFPIHVSADVSGNKALLGVLESISWGYGKTNEVVHNKNGPRVLMTNVTTPLTYNCYGAVAFPHDDTNLGVTPLPTYACAVGGPV